MYIDTIFTWTSFQFLSKYEVHCSYSSIHFLLSTNMFWVLFHGPANVLYVRSVIMQAKITLVNLFRLNRQGNQLSSSEKHYKGTM